MAFEESNGGSMYMPVAPAYGSGNGMGFGGDWSWIIIVLLLCGGWGGYGGFGGFGGMMGMGMMDGFGLYPWLNNSQNINDGFRDQQLSNQIGNIQNAVTSGFGDVQTALCGGFAGVNATVNNAQNALSQQLYSNEIASLNRSFAEQTANATGFNGVQSSLCDIRYGNATNTQNIITALNAGVQSIKDQLYADKLSSKDDIIAQLRQENLFARGQASQIAQDARIIDGVYDRLSQCPVGTTPVFGNQPIFTCSSYVGNSGCGCGCGGNGFAN